MIQEEGSSIVQRKKYYKPAEKPVDGVKPYDVPKQIVLILYYLNEILELSFPTTF